MAPSSSSQASSRLRAKIDLVTSPLAHALDRFLAAPGLHDLVPEYFTRVHCLIRATVPLLDAAAARAAALAGTDPTAATVCRYLQAHAAEELHHDDWLLDDLEIMGVDRATVLARVPSPTVARLVGAQYYWAFHFSPLAVLGYLAAMEGFPPSPALVDRFVAGSGYPPEAFRTLAYHGRVDRHHRDDLDRLLNSVPLTPAEEGLIGLSAISTIELLARSLDDVLDEAPALGARDPWRSARELAPHPP